MRRRVGGEEFVVVMVGEEGRYRYLSIPLICSSHPPTLQQRTLSNNMFNIIINLWRDGVDF